MLSEGPGRPSSAGGSPKPPRRLLALAAGDPLARLILAVAALGLVAFATLLLALGSEPWPLLPWFGFTIACAFLVALPYRVHRSGESYFMDFDEILLVVSLLFLGPAATVAVLVVGYLLGAMARDISARRLVFNAGARSTAACAALACLELLPDIPGGPAGYPAGYLVEALVAAAVYTLINQILVSNAIALLNGTRVVDEFREAFAGVLLRSWPLVVSYGLLVGVAAQAEPLTLVLGAVPVALLTLASRATQQRRDEHVRMTGLYRAAQEMHEARTDEEILHILRVIVRRTLGVDGVSLRATPPFGDELGAWLPNRSAWVIVPEPASRETRRQDDAFLQAAASLMEASMERATLVGELERQSLSDPLTGANNRRYFHQALASVLEGANEPGGCLALLDIDHFKVINDTHGHDVGDDALKELVLAAREVFRPPDIVCRLGGDEFALILPGMAPHEAAGRLESLRRMLASVDLGDGTRGPAGFRVSAGVAGYPRHGTESMTLLRAADGALYRAKREGRNRVVVLEE